MCGGRQKKNKGSPVGEEVAEGNAERDDEYEARENGGEKGGVHGGLSLAGGGNKLGLSRATLELGLGLGWG